MSDEQPSEVCAILIAGGDDARLLDATLEHAAEMIEGITHWGLSQRERNAVVKFQSFAANLLRIQKSDSPERQKAQAV